jgi:hypothetical protein
VAESKYSMNTDKFTNTIVWADGKLAKVAVGYNNQSIIQTINFILPVYICFKMALKYRHLSQNKGAQLARWKSGYVCG